MPVPIMPMMMPARVHVVPTPPNNNHNVSISSRSASSRMLCLRRRRTLWTSSSTGLRASSRAFPLPQPFHASFPSRVLCRASRTEEEETAAAQTGGSHAADDNTAAQTVSTPSYSPVKAFVELVAIIGAILMATTVAVPFLTTQCTNACGCTAQPKLLMGIAGIFTLAALIRVQITCRVVALLNQRMPLVRKMMGVGSVPCHCMQSVNVLVGDMLKAALIFAFVCTVATTIQLSDVSISMPNFLRFLFPAETINGVAVEHATQSVANRILQAWLAVRVGQAVLTAKRPPLHDAKLDPEGSIGDQYLLATSGKLKGRYASRAGLYLLLDRAVDLAVFLTAFTKILGIFGVSLEAILAVAGVGALAISFAARPLVQNLIGGLIIFITNPFTVGEFVESAAINGRTGKAQSIGWVNVVVLTDTGLHVVPNDSLANSVVVNKSRMPLTDVAAATLTLAPSNTTFGDVASAEATLLSALKSHPEVKDAGTVAFFAGTTDHGLSFKVRFGLKSASTGDEKDTKRGAVLAHLYSVLQSKGLSARVANA